MLSDRGFADDNMLKNKSKSFFGLSFQKRTRIDLVKAIASFERLTQGIERFSLNIHGKFWKI